MKEEEKENLERETKWEGGNGRTKKEEMETGEANLC